MKSMQSLAKDMKTTDILPKLNRDYQTVKRFFNYLQNRRTRSDKGL